MSTPLPVNKSDLAQELDHNALVKLYEQTTGELQKLREFEWKIAATFVTFSGAFIALLLSDSFRKIVSVERVSWLSHPYPLKWALAGVEVLVAMFGVWCLWVTHHYLSKQRQLRTDLEDRLGFHDIDRFGTGVVLPVQYKTKKTFAFQLVGLVLPLTLLILVTQAFSIYLVWVL